MKHLSSPETAFKAVSLSSTHLQSSTGSNGRSAVHELVNVHHRQCFKDSSFYKEIQEIFDDLDNKRKFLLSCFTVFPENAVVKRRIFVYWGVGEELWDASAVTMLSQEAGDLFDYGDKGNVLPQKYWTSELLDPREEPVVKELKLKQKQLLEKKPSIPKESQSTSSSNSEDTDLEKIVTLFNVNEPFPDLELAGLMKKKDKNAEQIKEPSAKDWLSKMKDAKVVCLGSWPGSVKRNIEVESIEFLEGLKNSTGLRFLSLQGVSRITEIPEFIGNHYKLEILDLKECHNLLVLSKEIGKLMNLRYLDLSDCYLLARLPKEISAFVQLRVLEGLVISNPRRKGSATLEDLKELKKLRKPTINANSKDFPTDDDLTALQNIGGVLQKLTIAWRATLADQQGEAQNGGNASCWLLEIY
ncbi:uncharacterized protein LOC142611994 [Castanea sativa]|uniref:uncharacterized protein LOC142611994 n=1 Tax=Castanea sativa TaxID=21020 RepID=UPI003F649261